MPAAPKLGLYICTEAFMWNPRPGIPDRVAPGAVARKGHAVIDAYPQAWRELVVDYDLKPVASSPEPKESKPK